MMRATMSVLPPGTERHHDLHRFVDHVSARPRAPNRRAQRCRAVAGRLAAWAKVQTGRLFSQRGMRARI